MKPERRRDVAVVVSGALSAAGLFYVHYADEHPRILSHHHDYRTAALALVALPALSGLVSLALRPFTMARYLAKREDIDPVLRGLARKTAAVSDPARPVPAREVAVSVFVIRGFARRRYLRRIPFGLVTDPPMETPVKWRRGVGPLGSCWGDKKVTMVNVAAIDSRYGDYSEEQWNNLPVECRWGQSYEIFQMLHGERGTVIAAPLWRDFKVAGVLAIHVPARFHTGLDCPQTKEIARHAAAIVGNLLW